MGYVLFIDSFDMRSCQAVEVGFECLSEGSGVKLSGSKGRHAAKIGV
jgi:hypothetical protein